MAVQAIDNVLSDPRYRELNTALGYIMRVRDLMAKAKACGVDTSADEAYFDAMEQNLLQWKNQFFPTRP